jgi:HD-GYP domain-containing protein (c-di-GMP phosphodiesterase class II)
LRKETIEAVLKMAESIDYRDTQTYEHSQRLAGLTRRLAMRVELTAEHADEVVLASRVHDLGKIGISNDILLKQGPLTPEERKTMEEHPVIGASILANYSAFKTSVDIVRHHHERWDGNGYPDGLRGEEIPMGARIIAVVDAFDAMVADRPYRRGMPVTQAVDRIKDGMGSQFDPKVCAAFLQMLIDEGTYTPPERVPELRIVTAAPASSASAPQAAAR